MLVSNCTDPSLITGLIEVKKTQVWQVLRYRPIINAPKHYKLTKADQLTKLPGNHWDD